MAAENYWRYADARQQQQAMAAAVAAAQGMPPAATMGAAAATVAGGMPQHQQAAALAQQQQQSAAPSLKRARPDYGDVGAGQDMAGYYPRENAGYSSLRDNEAIGASYDRYLRNGMPSVGANEPRAVVAGMGGGGMGGNGMGGGGMGGYPVDDRRMMGGLGMDSRGMGYGARPEPPLPPDASNTLYVEGLPANCTRREVSHIFRPFVGFREVRLVNKESRHPGGDPHVLCFVDFETPAQATIALEALQGARDLPVVQADAQQVDEADAQQVDEADAQQEHKEVVHQSQKKDLPDHYRFAAYIALKALSKDREIQKKDKEHVADLLNTSLRTVDRIWKDANDQIARGEEVDVSSKKKGRCGRKRVDLDLSRISSIPLDKKSSMRALASSLEVPVSTLYRRFKWGDIRRHKSSLRPHVKRANKIDKLKLCISFLDKGTLTNEKGK